MNVYTTVPLSYGSMSRKLNEKEATYILGLIQQKPYHIRIITDNLAGLDGEFLSYFKMEISKNEIPIDPELAYLFNCYFMTHQLGLHWWEKDSVAVALQEALENIAKV